MDKEKSNALADQYKKVKSEGNDEKKKKPKGSFLGGDVDIETLSPMKFESRTTEKVRTPQEIAEAKAIFEARAEIERERRQKESELSYKNRPKIKTYIPDQKIGASRSDPLYNDKKDKWIKAFSAGVSGQKLTK